MNEYFDSNLNVIFPKDWDELNPNIQKKKEELAVASFLLKDRTMFPLISDDEVINIECNESPDFLISTNYRQEKIGLEIVKCYASTQGLHSIESYLNKICYNTISRIRDCCPIVSCCNYFEIEFDHDVLINGFRDKAEIESELQQLLCNSNKSGSKYIKTRI